MMSNAVKRLIALAASVAIIGVAYYGSYLPMKKSQAFIEGMRKLASVGTIGEFKDLFSAILAIPSPIGQEELVRHLTSSVTPFLSNEKNADVVPTVVEYVENNYRSIMDRGTGMSFTQNIFVLATMYQTAFVRTGDVRYLEAAKENYIRGLALAPNRPQFLYGLFDVYRMIGDKESLLGIKATIMKNWPDDDRVGPATDDFIKRVDEFERVNGPISPKNIKPQP
ncbi:MAG: hypothetical protein RL681_213 [Candidatus Parcubacteria bacterium]|jgi:hypothetical protein